MYMNVPGLKIVLPSSPHDVKGILKTALHDNNPVIFFQHVGLSAFREEIPDEDYKVIYSGKHDNSIMGVVNRDYDAAPVASTVMQRMMERGMFDKSEVRIIWESDKFPGTAYGYAYNLAPKLQNLLSKAFLTFDWKGTGLGKEFGKRADTFIPVDYKRDWKG